ncbi:hypothetical protein AA15669_0242 [Saccharibacter floricola DSM 15669]|uniref:Uncharacterized protein n=1 Tax=Saccharibacter floricola DSM 15669 TaxID=1123227 RepID=A0ABQ0NWD8_9PROT|nr:hypothetical protein AA15669_0242 [Saccharibacter floricola DSM 15669]
MTNTLKSCQFCGDELNKDNTLEWLRDAGDRIVVAAVYCLSCRHVVWRERQEGSE